MWVFHWSECCVVSTEFLLPSFLVDDQVGVSDGKFRSHTAVHVHLERIQPSGLAFASDAYTGAVAENTTRSVTVVALNVLGTVLNEHVHFSILNPEGWLFFFSFILFSLSFLCVWLRIFLFDSICSYLSFLLFKYRVFFGWPSFGTFDSRFFSSFFCLLRLFSSWPIFRSLIRNIS